MSELTAAVALAQLRKLDGIRDHCRRLKSRLVAKAGALAGFSWRLLADPEGDFGFELYGYASSADAATQLRERLDAQGVWCQKRTGTYPQYHRDYVKSGQTAHPALSPFRGLAPWPVAGYRAEDFPQTEDLTSRFVALPIGWRFTDDDVDHIAASLRLATSAATT
jgi:dTDP-4-amino-4,6-dideoxygalactose transaminase